MIGNKILGLMPKRSLFVASIFVVCICMMLVVPIYLNIIQQSGDSKRHRKVSPTVYCPVGTCVQAHGDCIVGQCICLPGYNGTRCELGSKPTCEGSTAEQLHRCYAYTEKYGSVRTIDNVQWKQSQSWELEIWKNATEATEDRVPQHHEWFNQFHELVEYFATKHTGFGKVVEFGSGPYTQSLFMFRAVEQALKKDTVTSVTLVDPLIDMYLQYVKHVSYRDNNRYYNGKPIYLLKAGVEAAHDLLAHDSFDTVVMINVVEHCSNGFTVLQTLYNSLKPGGILVFQEHDYAFKGFEWDEGHPIKLHASSYELLLEQFEPIYRRDLNQTGNYAHARGVYFIGRKRIVVL